MTAVASHEVDYIVVGGGSSGCVLASRLSEQRDTQVLLLEAGGRDDHRLLRMPLGFLKAMVDPRWGWGYMSEPEPQLGGRPLWVPRGRVLGGSSSINGMFYMRGHPGDYDGWAEAGCSGWSYREVLPYFQRAENHWRGAGPHHGGSGPLPVNRIDTTKLVHEPIRDAGRAAGHPLSEDIDGAQPEGFARGDVTIDARGRRASTSQAYLKPALERPNLRVEIRAHSTRVLVEAGRAVGIEYLQNGELRQARARREVILSGGAYNSPQLLMLSGIGPADELKALGIAPTVELPGVGRNLQEHPTVMLEFAATKPVTFLRELRLDRAAWHALRWQLFGSGPFATQINSCNGIIRVGGGRLPEIQLMCQPIRFDARPWFPGLTKPQAHAFSVGVCMLHPESRGRVTLRSAAPTDAPRLHFNLFSDARDWAVMRAGIREARRVYRSGPQGALTGSENLPGDAAQSDDALDAFIRQAVQLCQHPVGTCAMGAGEEAVVDPQLRVRGIEGLRVADASVMPTVPGGNTNAACIMIGEKAADLVRGSSIATN